MCLACARECRNGLFKVSVPRGMFFKTVLLVCEFLISLFTMISVEQWRSSTGFFCPRIVGRKCVNDENLREIRSLASHTLVMKTEGLVQYGYHTCSSGMCGMLYIIVFNYIH